MSESIERIDLNDYKYYRNRELSWLQFDLRVLEEATSARNPLFERMLFLSISASNLDEFTVVRVASLKDMVHAGYTGKDIAGMNPTVQLSLVAQACREVITEQYSVYNNKLLCELKDEGIELLHSASEMSEAEKSYSDRIFESMIFPLLTPMAVRPDRPFPLIKNETINIAILTKSAKENDENEMVILQIPDNIERLLDLSKVSEKSGSKGPERANASKNPEAGGRKRMIFIEEIVRENLSRILNGRKIISSAVFRIMRNADLTIDVEEAEDLLMKIEEQIRKREWGEVIRLDIEDATDGRILEKLSSALRVSNRDTFFIHGPLDLTFLSEIYAMGSYKKYKEIPFTPAMPEWGRKDIIFDSIREKDRLLFCPYQSFDPISNLIDAAADDENVLAIKQTLYRVDKNSPIVAALMKAAKKGKQVTVLVELKARFDEEKNIGWARMLERAGAHVIYGSPKLKTHAKIALVIRKEGRALRRYMHLGTGNYNAATSKRYTDLSLFTSDDVIGSDATEFFNRLGGFDSGKEMECLIAAPNDLKKKLIELIDREKENALLGKPASIIAKMNSLCDADVIKSLYEASCAGVKIDLIIRGICCLKVGIPGVSENITVRSIVGRFLEHSRVMRFENGGDELMYLSSADWMPRNLERRVELMVPVKDPDARAKLNQVLINMMRDNQKARELSKDGRYYYVPVTGSPYCFQEDYISRSEQLCSD